MLAPMSTSVAPRVRMPRTVAETSGSYSPVRATVWPTA